jgi:hypothetical protein
MSEFTGETLYNLLPAVYRTRDVAQGEPLRALLGIIEREVSRVERNIDQLYDNWFIETCDEWVVPYIGDLLGVRTLHPVFRSATGQLPFSQRAYVANTLGLRRRKGTRSMLEKLAEDVTGWPALAVEFFQLLGTTQNLNHQRPAPTQTPSLRDASALELLHVRRTFAPRVRVVSVITIGPVGSVYSFDAVMNGVERTASYTSIAGDTNDKIVAGLAAAFNAIAGRDATAAANGPVGAQVVKVTSSSERWFSLDTTSASLAITSEIDPTAGELAQGPFERAAHTVEVRHAASGRGRYNMSQLGLFMWRLESRQLEEVVAVAAPDGPAGHAFRMNPLGADLRLFNRRAIDASLDEQNREANVPGPLRRSAVYQDLEQVRQTLVNDPNAAPLSLYFDTDPVIKLRLQGENADLPREQLLVCDLSTWKQPPSSLTYTAPDGTQKTRTIRASFDPVSGRVAFPSTVTPTGVRASFYYGFSGPIGGGSYDRSAALRPVANRRKYVVGEAAAKTLAQQLTQWATDKPASAVIEIEDSLDYAPADVSVPAGMALEIRSASEQRPLIAPPDPTVAWKITLADGSQLVLDGLLVAGGLDVTTAGQCSLAIEDATLVPGRSLTPAGDPAHPLAPSITVTNTDSALALALTRAITGAIKMQPDSTTLAAADSIIDGLGGKALDGVGTATLERVTVFGSSKLRVLTLGSDCIFNSTILVERTQQGCCRFSFVPPGSKVPRCYRCQPDLAITATNDPNVADRVEPVFTSERYGDPGYAQLAHDCAPEIKTGADDESEMGAFQFLHQPQREANLRSSLDEYLRFGFEAGLFFIS